MPKRGRGFDQCQTQPMRIGHRQNIPTKTNLRRSNCDTVLFEALIPKTKAAGWNGERRFAAYAVPRQARGHFTPGKKSQISAAVPFGICIEQMIRSRIIL